MDLISLATDFLSTPKGKLLLGEEINIAGITSRIQELSTTYNIDLEELASSTLSEKTFFSPNAFQTIRKKVIQTNL